MRSVNHVLAVINCIAEQDSNFWNMPLKARLGAKIESSRHRQTERAIWTA